MLFTFSVPLLYKKDYLFCALVYMKKRLWSVLYELRRKRKVMQMYEATFRRVQVNSVSFSQGEDFISYKWLLNLDFLGRSL
jgi:hypothetical protein